MTILHRECVIGCDSQPFDFATKKVASCDDIVAPDGSETKVVAGSNVVVTGTGTAADPYVVTAAAPTAPADGSETKVVAGSNVVVTGTGTAADPYVITVSGAETKVAAGDNVTITGSGTAADPYLISSPKYYTRMGGTGLMVVPTQTGAVAAGTVQTSPVTTTTITNPSATKSMIARVYGASRVNVINDASASLTSFTTVTEVDFGAGWVTLAGGAGPTDSLIPAGASIAEDSTFLSGAAGIVTLAPGQSITISARARTYASTAASVNALYGYGEVRWEAHTTD